MNVTLDPKDQKRLEDLARESGKEPGEFLRELVRAALSNGTPNGESRAAEGSGESCYELAEKAGIIGMISDLPLDFRTDPKTWEDFGRG